MNSIPQIQYTVRDKNMRLQLYGAVRYIVTGYGGIEYKS